MPNNSLSNHDHDAPMPNRKSFTGEQSASVIRMLDGHLSPDEDNPNLDHSNQHEI